MLVRTVETLVFCGALAVYGNPRYFTWWGVALYVIVNAALLARVGRGGVWVAAAAVVSITIALAVPVMSAVGCELFADTYRDMADVPLYIFGNFVLHYWPALRCVGLLGDYEAVGATFAGVRIILIYSCFFDPAEVYGCPVSPLSMRLAGVAAAVLVDASLAAVKTRLPMGPQPQPPIPLGAG